MKKNKYFNDLLKIAIEHNEKSEFYESISTLFTLLGKYLEDNNTKNLSLIYCHIGNNFRELKEQNTSLVFFNKGIEYSPDDEFCSLSKYLALADLDRDDEAIAEMFRYLNNYEAELYKTTIEELLEDLEEGYMADYEVQIRTLAKKHNIVIIPGESA